MRIFLAFAALLIALAVQRQENTKAACHDLPTREYSVCEFMLDGGHSATSARAIAIGQE